jgi:hypothetical protein
MPSDSFVEMLDLYGFDSMYVLCCGFSPFALTVSSFCCFPTGMSTITLNGSHPIWKNYMLLTILSF